MPACPSLHAGGCCVGGRGLMRQHATMLIKRTVASVCMPHRLGLAAYLRRGWAMRRAWPAKAAAVLFACLPVAAVQGAASTPACFSFTNMGQPAVLQADGDACMLEEDAARLPVRLANRLLVRAAESLDAASLQRIVPGVRNVQRLARLQTSSLWLLTLNEGDLQAALQSMRQHAGILHAQPDVLQLRRPASLPDSVAELVESRVAQRSPVAARSAARVAIIDDGFDLQHPAFAGIHLLLQYDADQRRNDASPKAAQDQHGTQVAGLILAAADGKGVEGLAPEAGLIAIRQVSSWTSDMVLAFAVARMMRADIVNASWTLAWLPEPLSDLIEDWLGDRQPPYVVVAAGNRHQDACTGNALGRIDGVWLVGARSADGQGLGYSNFGRCIALTAPARFTSTMPGQRYGSFGGTSAAAAHVSGLLARALGRGERPDLDSLRGALQPPMTQAPVQ